MVSAGTVSSSTLVRGLGLDMLLIIGGSVFEELAMSMAVVVVLSIDVSIEAGDVPMVVNLGASSRHLPVGSSMTV